MKFIILLLLVAVTATLIVNQVESSPVPYKESYSNAETIEQYASRVPLVGWGLCIYHHARGQSGIADDRCEKADGTINTITGWLGR